MRDEIRVRGPTRDFVAWWITDDLLLANLPFDPAHVDALAQAGIRVVLNLCEDREYLDGQRELLSARYQGSGVLVRLAVADLSAPDVTSFREAVEAARETPGPLAVHCRGGRERSATVVAAILADRLGVNVDEALRLVQAAAPDAAPLPEQVDALRRWHSAT